MFGLSCGSLWILWKMGNNHESGVWLIELYDCVGEVVNVMKWVWNSFLDCEFWVWNWIWGKTGF